jgi:hypothetical protein
MLRAIGAVVARFLHTEEVTGSNPVSPTEQFLRESAPIRLSPDSANAVLSRHWFRVDSDHSGYAGKESSNQNAPCRSLASREGQDAKLFIRRKSR